MIKFNDWLKTKDPNLYKELNFKDGGDAKHSLAAILASMLGGAAGGALGGPLGGAAGFVGAGQAMRHLYPATGKGMKKKMKKT